MPCPRTTKHSSPRPSVSSYAHGLMPPSQSPEPPCRSTTVPHYPRDTRPRATSTRIGTGFVCEEKKVATGILQTSHQVRSTNENKKTTKNKKKSAKIKNEMPRKINNFFLIAVDITRKRKEQIEKTTKRERGRA